MAELLCPHCLQPLPGGYGGDCPHCGRSLDNQNPEGGEGSDLEFVPVD